MVRGSRGQSDNEGRTKHPSEKLSGGTVTGVLAMNFVTGASDYYHSHTDVKWTKARENGRAKIFIGENWHDTNTWLSLIIFSYFSRGSCPGQLDQAEGHPAPCAGVHEGRVVQDGPGVYKLQNQGRESLQLYQGNISGVEEAVAKHL